jgi:uncharacterized small protein (TIGR04563 family)
MSNQVEQALWYPTSMLDDMQKVAAKLDKNISWCVQQAWNIGRREVAEIDADTNWRAEKIFEQRYADADKAKQTFIFPSEVIDEIKNEAARLDRSMSWLVARVWCVAREQVSKALAR